jgi:hypothetical protein
MFQTASPIAKKFALVSLSLVAIAAATGCETPAYSAKERGQQIARNWNMEGKMLTDDVDNALLLRPMTTLSRWNIR